MTMRRRTTQVPNSRQVLRRLLFLRAVKSVNERNLACAGDSHFRGMPRWERRALAKAYAASAWRDARLNRRAEAAYV